MYRVFLEAARDTFWSLINGFLLAFLQLNFLISSIVSMSLIQTGVNENVFFLVQWIDFFFRFSRFFQQIEKLTNSETNRVRDGSDKEAQV